MRSRVARLARFNVETSDEDDHMAFRGLPSPAAAVSVAGFAIMFHTLTCGKAQSAPVRAAALIGLQLALPLPALLAARSTVSRVPYPHVVTRPFAGSERSVILSALSSASWR